MIKKKVLIVDDQPENLRALVAIFVENGSDYNILQTISPQAAMDIAACELPDLIISDWEMPEMNGLEFIQELKENPKTKNIPVVIQTAVKLSASNLKQALMAGAIDYLRKPIDSTELLARCHSALKITEYYQCMVALKDKELTEAAVRLVSNHRFIQDLMYKLKDLKAELPKRQKSTNLIIDEMLVELEGHQSDRIWVQFQIAFDNVYGNFITSLLHAHPHLTQSEIKLCRFIRMGMSIKDIGEMLHKAYESVKVARSRLRRKLNLNAKESLSTYLMQF